MKAGVLNYSEAGTAIWQRKAHPQEMGVFPDRQVKPKADDVFEGRKQALFASDYDGVDACPFQGTQSIAKNR